MGLQATPEAINRLSGRTQWLHIACTVWLTFYHVSPKRGSLLLWASSCIGSPTTRWKGCCMPCATPFTCANSRRHREQWTRKMQRLLRRACHATHLARDVPLDPRLVNQFRRRYDIIVTEGLAFHQDQPPLATPATNGKRRGPRRTISFCVSAPARTTCCASWTIPPCPSPTIRPSATGA